MNKINRREALKVTAGALLAGTGISANRLSAAKRVDDSTSINPMHKPIIVNTRNKDTFTNNFNRREIFKVPLIRGI